jgi:hypothetical protein
MRLFAPQRRVLCSIGAGPHAELLELTGPSFATYAQRHGYDLDLRTEVLVPERPAPWSKVRLFQELLVSYDLVVWVDADAAIVDGSQDIADLLGPKKIAMVAHATPEGDHIPNTGVLVLRSHRSVRAFLDDVWEQKQFLHHKWWENAAWLTLLGYELEPTVHLVKPTRMYFRTAFLSNEWNSVPGDSAERPRIVHCAGQDQATRLSVLGSVVRDSSDDDGTPATDRQQ